LPSHLMLLLDEAAMRQKKRLNKGILPTCPIPGTI
jgi:hypothetical protein